MPTYYIDPQNGNDSNNGLSPSLPKANPPSSVAGDTWLFKRGSRYTPSARTQVCNLGQDNMTLSAYGEGDRPVLDATNCTFGVQISTDKANILISGIRVTNVGANTSRRGIVNATTASSGTVTTNITVENCEIDNVLTDSTNDCNGIMLWGTGNTVRNCVIHDIATDGIWFRGNSFTARGNRIYKVAQDGRVAGDCIQNSTDATNFLITENYLDHSDVDDKQCIIVQSSTGSGEISYNTVIGFDSATHTPIYVDCPDVDVFGNIVFGGNTCIALLSTRDNCNAYSNVCINNFNRGIDGNSPNCQVYNNTVISDGTGVLGIRHNNASATSVVIKNNVVVGFLTGVAVTTNGSASYNCIWGANNSVSGASLGTNFNADPLLDPRYKPTNRILADGGDSVSGTDVYGNTFRSQVVGAVDMGGFGFASMFKSTEARGNSEDFHGSRR